MAVTPRLDLRQSQALVMTPQLQQAIKLLQLSNLELAAYVEEELQRNPMLERDEGDRRGEGDAPGADPDDRGDDEADPAALNDIDFDAAAPAELESGAGLDVDYENIYTSNSDGDGDAGTVGPHAMDGGGGFSEPAYPSGGGGFDMLSPDIEQTLSDLPSLREHLVDQLTMDVDDGVDRLIGFNLIDRLDEAGYIAGDLAEIADSLGCEPTRVEAVLARLQDFDPPGIFARDLRECLALQLRDQDRLDPCMAAFLDNLDLLAAREFKKLEAACDCDSEDLEDMIAEIKTLNPKPALAFDQDVTQPITPDVLMRAAPGGGWVIELNNESLPRVLVNNHYYARLKGEARTKDERHYIAEHFQTASWLVKALHQRATTILKVATELVSQQEKFFTHGVQFLKPLVLRDIADEIEMHESTVSRVTSNKYMATPRGIYELKYFFTPAIASTAGGDAHSAEAVRHRIKELIDAEPPKKILSDDKIVTLLRADGIDIARRTVAKYREAMKIPSSVQRRRDKAALT
ncbi:MAG: RNA polymerase factor sigma-54 [Magnetovibrio sp.]|nr:RNA polymerase factor sigma-54 [Magnetovibrio sp.]